MKKILFCLLIGLLSVAACNNDDNDLKIFVESFDWDENVWEQTVDIKVNGKWSVSSNVDWCGPYQSSGEGDKRITLWVKPNLTNTARTGKLTIRSGGDTKTIALSQKAFSGNLEDFTYQLPVIFHILYKDQNNALQYPAKGRMAEILKGVNRLYASNKMNIQFVMAKFDQDGKNSKSRG